MIHALEIKLKRYIKFACLSSESYKMGQQTGYIPDCEQKKINSYSFYLVRLNCGEDDFFLNLRVKRKTFDLLIQSGRIPCANNICQQGSLCFDSFEDCVRH